MRVTEDVYKISGISNVYLINAPTPFVIDTGDHHDWTRVKEDIEAVTSLNAIKKVIFTHLHIDHIGNSELFTQARFFAAAEEIEDFRSHPENFLLGNAPQGLYEFLASRLEPLTEKTLRQLECVSVPGHTRGSIALIDSKRKLIFTGDTVFYEGIGRTDFENSVPEKMDTSVSKIVRLMKKKGLRICPGHEY